MPDMFLSEGEQRNPAEKSTVRLPPAEPLKGSFQKYFPHFQNGQNAA